MSAVQGEFENPNEFNIQHQMCGRQSGEVWEIWIFSFSKQTSQETIY